MDTYLHKFLNIHKINTSLKIAAAVMVATVTITINVISSRSFVTDFLLFLLSTFLAVLESVSLEKVLPESPQSSEAGDMSPCRSPSTPRHLRYRQPGGNKSNFVWLCSL